MRTWTKEKGGDGRNGLWGWTSMIEASHAGELGLLSEGWEGAETFYIMADDMLTPNDNDTSTAMELLVETWDPLRYGIVNRKWWKENPRNGFFDCTKAKQLLGWKHEERESTIGA